MKFEGIGIAATATWIPKTTESVEDALASGSLSEDDLEGLGVKELPVSEDLSAVEMAVLAAESALTRSGVAATDLDAVAHAWTFHQGYDMWSPPHYIADKLGAGRRTLPYGIQQSCNGGATALLLAAQAHASDPTSKASLVTTADRFGAPVWDRWASNPAVPLGDGATAAVIHRAAPSDALHLLSLAHASAPELWVTREQAGGFTQFPTWHEGIDARPNRDFYAAGGYEIFRQAAYESVSQAFAQSLVEAGLTAADPRIKQVVLPRLGPRVTGLMFGLAMDEFFPGRALRLGESTGHLGAGDMLANMHDLVVGGWLEPGDIAVVANGGGGYTWSVAVVEAPLP